MALRSYFLSPASEPQLTTTEEVLEVIKGLKVSKAPGPNGIPNRSLKHLPKGAVSLLARISNAVLRTHHFPQTWKHARVISILKPGKYPELPSSYRPSTLLDTIGKLFEKILLARISRVVNERGLVQDIARPCSWPSSLKKLPGISAKRGSPAQFSSTWPKPLIPSGSKASSTS